MKDVAILTKYYQNYNYGGMLQGYALQRAIHKLGYTADIISYDVAKNANPIYPNILTQAQQYGVKTASLKICERIIARGKFLINDTITRRILLFDEFMNNASMSQEIYSDETMLSLKGEYKVFVSGSDQVWNPNAVRDIYLQTFGAEPDRKISYAASIGRDSLSEREASVLIPAIERFGSISVREKTASTLLGKYIDAPITTVIDPTMLLSADEWAEVSSQRVIEDEYAISYFFSDSLGVRKRAEEFCLRHGLKLVMIPYAKQEYNLTDQAGPGMRHNNTGPREFLSLISNAAFVLTDSFHGAAFALLHQIPFAVFERSKKSHVSMNSRLYDLLDSFGESHRMINLDQITGLDALLDIDSAKIQRILFERREKSIGYLKNAIAKGISECEQEASRRTISGNESNCTGCGACLFTCPKDCISLRNNENGFQVPLVDDERCIECGACLKICPVSGSCKKDSPKAVFGAYAKKCQRQSASGGLSHVLAEHVIDNGGIVYGAAYDERLHVSIIRVNSSNQLGRVQGSKYVQADMNGVIESVVGDLKNNKTVLFTGTPCEIAGVKAIAKEQGIDEKLYTVEIICHGVPSPEMFEDYIDWYEGKIGKTIDSYAFRSKERDADKDFMIKIHFSNGSERVVSGFKDPYYKMFLSGLWFRESCYECPFATKERVSDITLGDFWNDQKLPRNFGKGRRVSIVLVNTEKGFKLFDSVRDSIELMQTTWKIASSGNANLKDPTRRSAKYRGYGAIGSDLFDRAAESRTDVKRLYFNQLPTGFRQGIRKLFDRG